MWLAEEAGIEECCTAQYRQKAEFSGYLEPDKQTNRQTISGERLSAGWSECFLYGHPLWSSHSERTEQATVNEKAQ
jgi:hypothetical protein